MTAISASSAPNAVVETRRDFFFQGIVEHLLQDDLEGAVKILRSGNASIHRNLTEKNIEVIIPFISGKKEGASADQLIKFRVARFQKILEKTFPDVLQIMFVKQMGMEVGLSIDEVNKVVQEVEVEGIKYWTIQTVHTAKFDMWEDALVSNSSDGVFNFFSEDIIRDAAFEAHYCQTKSGPLAVRGCLRGLESEETWALTRILGFYMHIMESPTLLTVEAMQKNENDFGFDPQSVFMIAHRRSILQNVQECMARPLMKQILEHSLKTKPTKIAAFLHKSIFQTPTLLKGGVDIEKITKIVELVTKENFSIGDWVDYLEVQLRSCLAEYPDGIQKAANQLIEAGKKVKENAGKQKDISPVNLETFNDRSALQGLRDLHIKLLEACGWKSAQDELLTAIRRPRDAVFAKAFCSEWPTRNPDLITVVMIGENHIPGFNAEVEKRLKKTEAHESKDEQKSDKKD